ncbi:MAG: hypothetical protein AAGJ40_00790 [Planctomycetota bacterium]
MRRAVQVTRLVCRNGKGTPAIDRLARYANETRWRDWTRFWLT